MGISDAAINALPLGKDVYDDLGYCLQEWQDAGHKAAAALPGPEEASTMVDWVISLVGNLAWAATVFFPPAFATATVVKVAGKVSGPVVYASASAATKAVSMLGATVAAGTVGQLRQLAGKLNSPQGKEFLSKHLGTQIPEMRTEYAKGAEAWAQKDLVNHLISEYGMRSKPDPRKNNDAEFTTFYNSFDGAAKRRKYVWEDFVFPGTHYDNLPDDKGGFWPGGQVGLQDHISAHLIGALADFNRQWKVYQVALERYVRSVRPSAQSQEGPVTRYLREHPFNPVLSYDGVPQKIQAQQNANRIRLKKQYDANK